MGMVGKEMMDNIITEVGFILLGGAVAFIPVYILGLVLKGEGLSL